MNNADNIRAFILAWSEAWNASSQTARRLVWKRDRQWWHDTIYSKGFEELVGGKEIVEDWERWFVQLETRYLTDPATLGQINFDTDPAARPSPALRVVPSATISTEATDEILAAVYGCPVAVARDVYEYNCAHT